METKEQTDQLTKANILWLILIVLVLCYFPYKMIKEHDADVKANSAYLRENKR